MNPTDKFKKIFYGASDNLLIQFVRYFFVGGFAFIVDFAGGVLGIITSFLMSFIVNLVATKQASEMTSSIPVWLYLSAVAFATVIGVLSGYLPAKRAMKLSALTAIKTE